MASNERKKAVEDEQKKQEVADSLIKSALRRGSRANNVRELGTSLLKSLPTSIPTIQKFMKAVNWAEAQGEVQQSLNNTIAIVGLPNTGKSTLFNKIKGQQLSPVSPEAGTNPRIGTQRIWSLHAH